MDVYAISPTQKPKLNFQITIVDGGILETAAQNTLEKFKVIEFDGKEAIKKAIERKTAKYSYSDAKDIILLIGGYSAIASPALIENQLRGKYDNSAFMGIYYVLTAIYPIYPKGFVVAIKNAFIDRRV